MNHRRVAFLILLAVGAATAQNLPVPSGMPATQKDIRYELTTKLKRIDDYLVQQHLGAILLTNVQNVSWVTAGLADSHIVITSEAGGASLLILRGGNRFCIGEAGEVKRLMSEDLVGLGYVAKPYIWHEEQMSTDRKLALIHEIVGAATIATDMPFGPLKTVDIAPLRYELTPGEIKKYRTLGTQVTEAVIATVHRIKPGFSEQDIEATASDELMRRQIRPAVLLMGVDRRVMDLWHHTPTTLRLQHYAIVNVCARRWGLVVSVARFVYFGNAIPDDLRRKERAAMEISARYQAHSSQALQPEKWLPRPGVGSQRRGSPVV